MIFIKKEKRKKKARIKIYWAHTNTQSTKLIAPCKLDMETCTFNRILLEKLQLQSHCNKDIIFLIYIINFKW